MSKAFEQYTENELRFEALLNQKKRDHEREISLLKAQIGEMEEIFEEEREKLENEIEILKKQVSERQADSHSSLQGAKSRLEAPARKEFSELLSSPQNTNKPKDPLVININD